MRAEEFLRALFWAVAMGFGLAGTIVAVLLEIDRRCRKERLTGALFAVWFAVFVYWFNLLASP